MNKDKYENDLVSVIIPAYNVEKYIGECIQSVCNQSYEKLEIIIVDDGSTDNTGKICDCFSDSRIIVKHQHNQGLSGARNTGLSLARGEYIAFIDSDDFIRESMIDELVGAIKSTRVDMAVCGVEYLRCDNGKSSISGDSGKIRQLNYEESLDYLCRYYFFNVWNKLYKHYVIDGIQYKTGVVCEDVGYMREVFERINSSVYVDCPLYVYRVKRPGSSGMTFDARKLPAVEEYEKFIDYLSNRKIDFDLAHVRFHQLALIRSLYCETEDNDRENRKKMYHLYMDKASKNGVWKRYLKSIAMFILLPNICRSNVRKSILAS